MSQDTPKRQKVAVMQFFVKHLFKVIDSFLIHLMLMHA